MTNDTYRCTTCGAVIPEREDGFLQVTCDGCGGVGFVKESDYVEYFEKPVSPPPREHRPRCEFVIGSESVTVQDELGGWLKAKELTEVKR